MITIFINNNPIYLTDDLKYTSKTNFFYFDKIDIQMLIEKMGKDEIRNAYLYGIDVMLLLKKFKKNFKIIEAAGGVVENAIGEILFIYRYDKWDLPKGKIEKNEEIRQAALREVEEECGIKELDLKERLAETYHIYKMNQNYILKVTYWFSMSSNFKGKFKPQIEEGITKVKWVSKKNLPDVLANTYGNIKLCINDFLKK